MRKPSLALILPLCVALAAACSGDAVGIEPQSQNQRDSYSGVYDLTAPITRDGGFGYLDSRFTAVLTLRQGSNDPRRLEGTYEGLQLVGPDGDSRSGPTFGANSGLASMYVGGALDDVSIYLEREADPGFTPIAWSGEGMLGSGQIVGTWAIFCYAAFPDDVCQPWLPYGFRGTFTAVRR
jgi:hypothetical protein